MGRIQKVSLRGTNVKQNLPRVDFSIYLIEPEVDKFEGVLGTKNLIANSTLITPVRGTASTFNLDSEDRVVRVISRESESKFGTKMNHKIEILEILLKVLKTEWAIVFGAKDAISPNTLADSTSTAYQYLQAFGIRDANKETFGYKGYLEIEAADFAGPVPNRFKPKTKGTKNADHSKEITAKPTLRHGTTYGWENRKEGK